MGVKDIVKESGWSEYTRIHRWISYKNGKPNICSKCGTKDSKRYEWANISGKYKEDIKDWIRLCKSCHGRMDFSKTHCYRGHELVGDNLYSGEVNGLVKRFPP